MTTRFFAMICASMLLGCDLTGQEELLEYLEELIPALPLSVMLYNMDGSAPTMKSRFADVSTTTRHFRSLTASATHYHNTE